MNPFKTGMNVVFSDPQHVRLTHGKSYKVLDATNDNMIKVRNDVGSTPYYFSSRFKLQTVKLAKHLIL